MMPLGLRSKIVLDDLGDLAFGNRARAECVDEHRYRLRHADDVGELHLAALRQFRCDDIFRHVTRHISRAAIDLGRILSGKRAAAMPAHAAVGVDDDFPTR